MAENQPGAPFAPNKTAMSDNDSFLAYAGRLRAFLRRATSGFEPDAAGRLDEEFNELALDLFTLQRAQVEPYRRFLAAGGRAGESPRHWREIPPVPTVAFKELELSSLPPAERTVEFHSSGTTEQRPSRHFHNETSLALYEASLLPWFERHLLPEMVRQPVEAPPAGAPVSFLFLTPPPAAAPRSSLVWMLGAIARRWRDDFVFAGRVGSDGGWELDQDRALAALADAGRRGRPVVVAGTAFNFVHLLDALAGRGERFELPAGSRVMETGGYKGRSRRLPREQLHEFIAERLGVPASAIVCEYGMSELSSQAYDGVAGLVRPGKRVLRFPPWARALVVSVENGIEVPDGGTGLIRVFDLANVRSVLAVQTEDLGRRRGDGFELLGRVTGSEPRGCSRMTV